jgi:hypothetical protein
VRVSERRIGQVDLSFISADAIFWLWMELRSIWIMDGRINLYGAIGEAVMNGEGQNSGVSIRAFGQEE